jgi:ribosome-associated protein
MANEFVTKEVKKILGDSKMEYPSNVAYATSWIIANFKGVNLKIFDARGISSLSDYFVIASTTNAVQSRAITDEIIFNARENEVPVLSTEGLTDAQWVLIDLGDIIIHLFQDNSRDVYDLDTMWSNMPQLEIPNDYYHSSIEMNISEPESETPGGYF